MEDLRQLINLVESAYDPELVAAVEVWSDGYNKDDAFADSNSARAEEDRIIALARRSPSSYHGMLYRGTGISDEQFLELESGKRILFRSSPARRILSWTKDPYVADSFARDAWADGEGSCAIVIAIPADQLDVLVDVGDALGMHGEQEVLTLNQELTLDHSNVIKLYRYEEL